jgi:hypothetical protein
LPAFFYTLTRTGKDPDPYLLMAPVPDPGGPKTCGSCGSVAPTLALNVPTPCILLFPTLSKDDLFIKVSLHVSLIPSPECSPCCRKLTIGSIHFEHPLVLVVGGLVALEHEDEARQLLVVHGLDLSQRQSDQEPWGEFRQQNLVF